MKLRLRENSIRLRLLQSEIELLRQSGRVSEKIQFNERRTLTYTLVVSAAEEISSRYEMDEIVIEIPLAQAREWTTTELVGLKNKQTINGNSTLEITLEKDFVCADRPFDADNRDAFARPSMQNC
jgi:hypothetical protein